MKAFYFLSAVADFSKGAIVDGRDLITKIKDTPVACVQTENQFIFIYEME